MVVVLCRNEHKGDDCMFERKMIPFEQQQSKIAPHLELEEIIHSRGDLRATIHIVDSIRA